MDGRSATILLPPLDDMTGRGADAQLPTLASRRGLVPVKKAPPDDGAESNWILGRGFVASPHALTFVGQGVRIGGGTTSDLSPLLGGKLDIRQTSPNDRV
jgi:hypothetical protein